MGCQVGYGEIMFPRLLPSTIFIVSRICIPICSFYNIGMSNCDSDEALLMKKKEKKKEFSRHDGKDHIFKMILKLSLLGVFVQKPYLNKRMVKEIKHIL